MDSAVVVTSEVAVVVCWLLVVSVRVLVPSEVDVSEEVVRVCVCVSVVSESDEVVRSVVDEVDSESVDVSVSVAVVAVSVSVCVSVVSVLVSVDVSVGVGVDVGELNRG